MTWRLADEPVAVPPKLRCDDVNWSLSALVDCVDLPRFRAGRVSGEPLGGVWSVPFFFPFPFFLPLRFTRLRRRGSGFG